jgi:hypothetical protein
VLTNIGIAGMNGWEMAERLRILDRSVALLFITDWDCARTTRAGSARWASSAAGLIL